MLAMITFYRHQKQVQADDVALSPVSHPITWTHRSFCLLVIRSWRPDETLSFANPSHNRNQPQTICLRFHKKNLSNFKRGSKHSSYLMEWALQIPVFYASCFEGNWTLISSCLTLLRGTWSGWQRSQPLHYYVSYSWY